MAHNNPLKDNGLIIAYLNESDYALIQAVHNTMSPTLVGELNQCRIKVLDLLERLQKEYI